jgi:hypothetical protein
MSDKTMPQYETKPTPDPTILTTEQLLREVASAREITNAKLEGLEKAYLVRFDGIEREFHLINERRIEQKIDTKSAVDAAFNAAKEAVTKSEINSTEAIRQQNATFSAELKGVIDTLNDVKDRVNRMEAVTQGISETRTGQRLDINMIVAVLALGALVVSMLLNR